MLIITDKLNDMEYDTVVGTAKFLEKIFKFRYPFSIKRTNALDGEKCSADGWYDTYSICTEINENIRNEEFAILVTSRPLVTPSGIYNIFGYTFEGSKSVLVTTYTARQAKFNKDDMSVFICSTILHEVGHYFGMAADLHRANTIEWYGPHCTNKGCAMNQNVDVRKWVDNFRNSKVVYCDQCLHDAEKFIRR